MDKHNDAWERGTDDDHHHEREVPLEVKSKIVRTPINPKQVGHPHTSRVSSESSRRGRPRKYSRCGKIGHNYVRCTEHITTEESGTSESSFSRPRRPRHCSICHVVDHTKTTCPQRAI